MSLENGRDIAELFRRVNNLLRVGKVVAVDYGKARARVKIGGITTDFLPWLVPSTATWFPLKKGEQVVVLSPNGDFSFAMILPALYQSAKPAPSSDAAKIVIVADIAQTGNLTASGEVEASGTKLSKHTHDFDYRGAGQGSTPQSGTTKKPS